ncbi:MAG: type II toxin-antitoxin system RelE/ParE family toxin [Gordonia sp. (in: high G+C Gram-positive bacteria)]|uniref:type II toxin-antitoxin system RelE family toxin n=1 Tax=Gordonia sp. (in: high G+C Gram-positive bacteria) TaxID=84139 RepID=UPI0039E43846
MPSGKAYTVEYTGAAARELAKIAKADKKLARQIAATVTSLADEPRPPAATNYTAIPNAYRIRVRDHRILYTVTDTSVLVEVFRVEHRSSVYKKR